MPGPPTDREMRPVVGCYCATFLPPDAWHVYRQITGLRRFRPWVVTAKRLGPGQFPFDDLTVVPREEPLVRALRRFWHRQVRRAPVPLSGPETRAVRRALEGAGARLLHVFFGHVAARLRPLFPLWERPLVVSFHGADALVGLDRPAHLRAAVEVFARADLVLARSESLLAALARLGCPSGKLRLLRTGIPLGDFPFHAARSWPADGRWRFLQTGRLVEKKGYPTTLRAFAELRRTLPGARLVLAGDGPARADLEETARRLGLAGHVTFTGFLGPAALGAELRAAHLFVHPSETAADGNQEGVPNGLLEAMATGLPVLATRHGGIPEAVDEGTSGRMVPERDPAALAAAWRDLVAQTPERLAAMGAAGAAAVRARFSRSAQVARLEALYDEALDLGRT